MIARALKWAGGFFVDELPFLLLAGIGLFAFGCWVGHVNTANAEAAKQLKQSRQLTQLLDKAAEISRRETATLRDELATLQADKEALEERLNHVPLVVSRVPACPPRAVVARAPGAEPAAAGAPAEAAPRPARADGADGLQLTAGAVRLWNDALTGLRVPGDRRGAAAGAERAGAAGAEVGEEDDAAGTALSVADAWANHITNASSCREDRARLARLTAAVRERQNLNP